MSYTNYSADQSTWKTSYQICPIFLQNGIAQGTSSQNSSDNLMPITQITELGSDSITDSDQYLCHYQPMPGGELIHFEAAEYPFANQFVAANAIIAQPLRISLRMSAPSKMSGDYVSKLNVFTSLQNTLMQHCISGGTFSVATPAFLYDYLLLLKLTDVTGSEAKQVQFIWQWDFLKPLITQQQAAAAQSNLMNKITNGVPITGTPATSGGNGAQVPGAPSPVGSSITAPQNTNNGVGNSVAGTNLANF